MHIDEKTMEGLWKQLNTVKLLKKETAETLSEESFVGRVEGLIENIHNLWQIIEYSANSISVVDKNGQILYIDKVFEAGTGVSAEALVGKGVEQMEESGVKPSVSAIVLQEKRKCTVWQNSPKDEANWVATGVPILDKQGQLDMVVTNAINVDEISKINDYFKSRGKMVCPEKQEDEREEQIYKSAVMKDVLHQADKVKTLDTTVLITGESGSGKGVLSRYIHRGSKRAENNYIEINCSAIPENLFESELFGYESGAFSGAKKGGKLGLFEMADKGTLVLDEIGDMPIHMQVKLLKVIQDKQIIRVGGTKPIKVDIRILASTNQDLQESVKKGLFREDLYYRLDVFPIHIPPLRKRKEDIEHLLSYYFELFKKKYNRQTILTDAVKQNLLEYSWPGNVRELEHAVERIVIMNEGITEERPLAHGVEMPIEAGNRAVEVRRILPLARAIEETERQLFQMASEKGESSYQVARKLETSQPNAYRKMKKYQIEQE